MGKFQILEGVGAQASRSNCRGGHLAHIHTQMPNYRILLMRTTDPLAHAYGYLCRPLCSWVKVYILMSSCFFFMQFPISTHSDLSDQI
jgi:hypothetical protein